MRKSIVYILPIIFFIIVLSACKSKPRVVNIQATWKSTDPAGIPLSVREKEFAKKNLILNPSFEEGRYYNIDTSKISFNLHGWKKAGEKVYWTDVQNQKEYRPDEAFNGLHAIKITRKNADETDPQGEGIISDFIKVIPGNYKLSFYIKLGQVESNLSRMSNSLYEAVNIRIFFYDKNKVLIHSNIFNPGGNNYVDNSFKGFSFTNMTYVDELGWGKAQGKTAHYPFNEGDIPDDARYVKIFFGLKGNGKMWVDMVDFRYSDDNFSLFETTEALFDSLMPPSSNLIPSPHQLSNYSPQALRISANDKILDPLILIPLNAENGILKAAEKLSLSLGEALKGKAKKPLSIGIINKLEQGMIESDRLIFSLGKTRAFNENAGELPLRSIAGKSQAYFVSILPSANRLIIIGANDDEGYIHAGNILAQLINKKNQVYHHYDIIDYPDIENRALILPLQQENRNNLLISLVNTLTEAGFNLVYFQDSEEISLFSDPEGKIQKYTLLVSGINSGSPNTRFGISLLNMRFARQTEAENRIEFIGKHSENTGKLVRKYSAAGFTNFIFTDDLIWDYMDFGAKSVAFKLITPLEFGKFIDNRNIFLSGIVNNKEFKAAKKSVLFLPVLSNNEDLVHSYGYSAIYFEELQKYSNLFEGLLWEGPVDYPGQIDFTESCQFKSMSRMQNYLFLNTLTTRKENKLEGSYASLYPGKARLGSIFEAFNVDMAGTPKDLDLPSFCLINQTENSAINKIRLITAADYMWNKEAYNPSVSLWKALIKLYGKEEAMQLIRFNDKYYQLLQLCMIMEKERFNQKDLKAGEDIILSMNSHWNEITKNLASDINLLNELADLKNQVIARFYQIKRPSGSN
jgi:hypothetical protein